MSERSRAEIADAYPLSRMQSGMYYHYSTHEGESLYHDVFSIRIASRFDDAAFRDGIATVIAAHPVLRTSFDFTRFSQPMQLVHKQGEVRYRCVVADSSKDADLEALIREEIAALERSHFDLQHQSLIRFTVIPRNDAEFQLLVDAHHMILDGWSMALLLTELFQNYLTTLGMLPQPLEPKRLRTSFKEFIRAELQEIGNEGSARFWRDYLAVHEYQPFTFQPETKHARISTLKLSLAEPSHDLKRLAQVERVMLRDVLLAAHLHVCAFVEGSSVASTTLVANGRLEVAGADEVLGLFLNSVPLRVPMVRQTWRQLIQAVKGELQIVMPHRRYPFAEIAKQHGSAICDISFNFVHFFVYRELQGVAGFEIIDGAIIEKTNFKLSTTFHQDVSGNLELLLSYDESAIGAAGAARIAAYYEATLRLMLSEPDNDRAAAELLSAPERALLAAALPAQSRVRERGPIHSWFERRAQHPDLVDQTAVQMGGIELSYGALNQRANRLARHLRAQGVGPDVIVGVCMQRSIEMIVAMLAVLKAGGACLPLDPSYPRPRLRYMVADSAVGIVIVHGLPADFTRQFGECVLRVEAAADDLLAQYSSDDLPPVAAHSDRVHSDRNLAYVIYTSGSTGRPKGVMVEHRGVVQLVIDPGFITFDRDSVVLQLSSMSFDAAMFEIWGALLNGGKLVLYPQSDIDFSVLNTLIREQRINRMWLMARLFDSWSQELPALEHRLEVAMGGEVVNPQTVARVYRALPTISLINGYGPTENSILSCCHRIPRTLDEQRSVPLGRAVNHTRVHVLSRQRQQLPPGAVGRLHVAGEGLARGYVGLPELTRERFIANPFTSDAADRFYDTGDLVRLLSDGTLEYIGRIDDQVKIRGFRVELGEIEQCLGSLQEVESCRVRLHQRDGGHKQLIAYVIVRDAYRDDWNTCRVNLEQKLRDSLPDYMVPSLFMRVEQWPVNPNGKIDLARLPTPLSDGAASEYVAPLTGAERTLVDIWADLLKVPAATLSVAANFFELGGDSILSINVVSRAAKQGLHFTVKELFLAKSIRGLAGRITAASAAASPEVTARDLPDLTLARVSPEELQQWQARVAESAARIEALYPATGMQRGMLFHSDWVKSSYVSQISVIFHGLYTEHFQQAWRRVIQRHAILRTVFVGLDSGHVHQLVLDTREVEWQVRDLRSSSTAQQREIVGAYRRADQERGFEISLAPLMRLSLLQLSDFETQFVWSHHHALLDGWSVALILAEVTECYRALIAGQAAELAEVTHYRHYAAWLQRQDLDAARAFWRERLRCVEGATGLPLAEFTGERSRHQTKVIERLITFSAEETRQLTRLAQLSGTTLGVVLLAGWAVLLSRYSGMKQVVFGTVVSGRPAQLHDVERMAGLFINTIPVVADVQAQATLCDWLRTLHRQHIESDEYSHLPLAQIQQLAPRPQALFDSLVVFENFPIDGAIAQRLQRAGLTTSDLEISSQTNYGITLTASVEATLTIKMGTYAGSMPDSQVAQVYRHLQQLLLRFADAPRARLGEIEMLTDAEVQAAMLQLEPRKLQYPCGRLIHQLFEAQAQRCPQNVAAVCQGQELTYGELNARANQLAHELSARGAGPDVLVGLYLERSLDLLVAMLAILKAGSAYVPLAPEHPPARVEHILADAALSIVITERRLAQRLSAAVPHVICLDDPASALSLAARSALNPHVAGLGEHHLSYVIYTSGSTGQPKGVMVEHRNVMRLFDGVADIFAFDAHDCWVMAHSFAFDFSVWELWGALIHGGRVVLAPPEVVRDAARFSALLEQHGVTVLNQTPTAFYALMYEMLSEVRRHRLRYVIFGGEMLNFQRLRPWFESGKYEGTRLINMYGITEITVHATAHEVTAQDLERAGSVIGKPLPHLSALVCNEALQLQPAGVVGELLLAGCGLARGYLNSPVLTEERFFHLPSAGGIRFYRTGDLVKRLPNGDLSYVGRNDSQVKIRGFRIELGEISNRLERSPWVSAAVADVFGEGEDKRLVAYVVPSARPAAAGLADELKAWLASQLPAYMVPANVMLLEGLPINANGKVDRGALPQPIAGAASGGSVAPVTESQARLCEVWQQILERDTVGIDDNFFELGGHSLLAARVNAQLKQQFGVDVGFDELFKRPTIRALAVFIDEELRLEAALSGGQAEAINSAEQGEILEM